MHIVLQKATKRGTAKAAAAVEVPAELRDFLERITALIKEKVLEAGGAPKMDHSVFFWPRNPCSSCALDPWNWIQVLAQHAVIAVPARSRELCSEESPELGA